jgi:hypothetical protein
VFATKTAKICAVQQVVYLHNFGRIKEKRTKFQSIKPILIQRTTSSLQETGLQRQLRNDKSQIKRNNISEETSG